MRPWLPATSPGPAASTSQLGSRRYRSGNGYQREFAAGEVEPLSEGVAEGVLYGGCLSLLCASLGTPYEIRTEGTILFIEDRAERPYRIDRMLMQLKLAGKFDGVQGIIFGEMIDCGEAGALDYTLQQVDDANRWRLADSNRLWSEVGPRFQRQHHLALRRAGEADGRRKRSLWLTKPAVQSELARRRRSRHKS